MEKLVPRLRFPGFEGELKKKRLNEVATINPSNASLPDIFVYIDLESVTNGVLTKEQTIEKIDAPSRAQRLLKKDDILYQTVRPYQKNNLYFNLVGNYVASTGYAQIRTNESSLFLYEYLHFQGFVDKVMENCTGTSYPSINSNDLGKIYISSPTLDEQLKVAHFLNSVSNKLNHLKKKKTLLEKYKKGMMQKIFNQEIRFKDEDGKDFGEWEEKTIGDLSTVSAGATPSTLNETFWGGSIRWMNSGELNLKRVYEVKNRITQKGLDGSSTKIIPAKSVLIGLAGQGKTRGTVAMNMIELCTNQSIASILPDEKKYVSDFLYHNLDSRYSELRELSTGDGGRGGLNLQIIKSMSILLPTTREQNKIANFLSAIDDKINLVSKEIEGMEKWKKGLLGEMFV